MSATREQMQEELDALRANAKERAQTLEDTKNRAKFLDDPLNEFTHGATVGISDTLGIPVDIVNAMANAVGMQADAPLGSGDNIADVMEYIQGAPPGIEREPQGVLGGAGEGVGMAAVITPAMLAPFMEAAMDPNFEIRQGNETRQFHGGPRGEPTRIPRSRAARMGFLLKQMGQTIAKTAVDNPKTFIASELAGAAASGAAVEYAKEEGYGTGAQSAAGMGAGVLAGLSPTAIPRATRNMMRWGMRNILPFTRAGAEARAATQMQARAGDAEAAAEAALNAPEGITPARATGEERLMAQERRVMEDDLELDKQVRDDLRSAIHRSEVELRSLYETPRGREAWEQSIFDRIAPEGVTIRSGTSEEMLNQLYSEFRPLYREFKGYPIQPNLFGSRNTPLETMITNVPQTNRIQAAELTRDAVARKLNSMWSGFKRRLKPNSDGIVVADSGDYLKFRQDLREQGRLRAKAGDEESAALYRIAEEKVNQVMRTQLEPEVLQDLGVVDSHYRNYKVLEDAVYRRAGTDQGLTPDGLLMALKTTASSKGGYARGQQLELRAAAASGKPIAKILDEPETIRRRVSGMSPVDLAHTQNDAMDTIYRMSIVADGPEERISGEALKRMLGKYDDSLAAARVDPETLNRSNAIADELMVAEQRSPAAVARLYEDGPSNILELVATLAGAKHGQAIAGRGMGSSMVLAGYFANKARGLLAHITTDQADALLREAQTNPELFAKLLTKVDMRPVEQNEAAIYLRNWLAVSAKPTAEEGGRYLDRQVEKTKKERAYDREQARRELDRISRQLQSTGANL